MKILCLTAAIFKGVGASHRKDRKIDTAERNMAVCVGKILGLKKSLAKGDRRTVRQQIYCWCTAAFFHLDMPDVSLRTGSNSPSLTGSFTKRTYLAEIYRWTNGLRIVVWRCSQTATDQEYGDLEGILEANIGMGVIMSFPPTPSCKKASDNFDGHPLFERKSSISDWDYSWETFSPSSYTDA